MEFDDEIELKDILEIVKEQNSILNQTMKWQFIVIIFLCVSLAATNIYYSYLWSKKTSIVVESSGGGSSSYIRGNENDTNKTKDKENKK